MALNSANGFPVFATILEANYVNKKQDVFASFKLTEEDRKEILRLSKDENIGKRVCIFWKRTLKAYQEMDGDGILTLFSFNPNRSLKALHLRFMDTRISRPPLLFHSLEVFPRILRESIVFVEISTF